MIIQPRIQVLQYYDGFGIVIDGVNYYFNQEDPIEGLVEVFKVLGFKDVEFEEVY